MVADKYKKTETLIKQLNISFGLTFASWLIFLGIANQSTFTNLHLTAFIILMLCHLYFYVQIGRIASHLNRSVISWVALCWLTNIVGSLYAIYKLPKLLRESVYQ